MVRVAEIQPGSIADDLRLEIGSRVVRINGEPVRDGIDLRFREVEDRIELEVSAPVTDQLTIFEIDKPAGETLGIVPAPDPVRQCANRCPFCFIDGNPQGARKALYLKDDDFRLSFTYGSYVTLTNVGPRGFERLIEQRLSPLYVSVHATEPEVRRAALGVPRGGDILNDLERLLGHGLEVHTQVVLCPGLNDGAHLGHTIEDLWNLGPGVLSLSVVPVGLTRYNLGAPIRLLTANEASRAIAQIDRARTRAAAMRNTGWAYAADEMFFIAGQPIPEVPYYDDGLLTENGVGAVRWFLDTFDANLPDVPRLSGRSVAIVTGERMGKLIAPLSERLAKAAQCRVKAVAVTNDYFGPTVTTAGLLAGMDILDAVQSASVRFDIVLIPAESLNDDGRFIDDVPFADVAATLSPARVIAAHEIATALISL